MLPTPFSTSYSSRKKDVSKHPKHKAYIWGNKFGISKVYVQVAAGGIKPNGTGINCLPRDMSKNREYITKIYANSLMKLAPYPLVTTPSRRICTVQLSDSSTAFSSLLVRSTSILLKVKVYSHLRIIGLFSSSISYIFQGYSQVWPLSIPTTEELLRYGPILDHPCSLLQDHWPSRAKLQEG